MKEKIRCSMIKIIPWSIKTKSPKNKTINLTQKKSIKSKLIYLITTNIYR